MTLQQVGHLQSVIDHARNVEQITGEKRGTIFERVRQQIINKARKDGEGFFEDSFSNSYDFSAVSLAHGNSSLRGSMHGRVQRMGEFLVIHAVVEYRFTDVFTDVFGIGVDVGQPYDINGFWKTRVEIIAYQDEARSLYRDDKKPQNMLDLLF